MRKVVEITIQTNTFLINLHDKILIKKNKKKKDRITFNGPFSHLVEKKNNSIKKTLDIMRKFKIIDIFYDVQVKKNIPVFSGLGGGTSNAFFVAKYLLKKKSKSNLVWNSLEKKIGSDFKIFYRKQTYQKNLSTLLNYEKKFTLFFLIVYPHIKCSTQKIYSYVEKSSRFSNTDYYKILSMQKLLKLLLNEKNDLQKIVEKYHPEIRNILNDIKLQKGCYYSRITGSGSVCYGVFKSKRLSILASKNINKKFPNCWSEITKTI